MKKELPEQILLRTLLKYQPENGRVTWRNRPRDMFSEDKYWRSWNDRCADTECFATVNNQGYFVGGFLGVNYLTHRIIWRHVTGEDPEQIDHINGNRLDNRWSNLRAATPALNAKNQRKRSTNSSGVTGVSWHKHAGKWFAEIMVDRKKHSLGYFDELSDATEARKNAEIEYGFHQHHGRR